MKALPSAPQRRATMKALPSPPHRPSPYGSPGLLPNFPAELDGYWLTARVNPTIRRISPLSPWRRSAGLVPVLGWCGQPFALSLSVHGRRKRPHPLPHRSRPYGSGPSLLLKISNRSRLYLYDSSPLSTCVSIPSWACELSGSGHLYGEICDGITKIELEHN